MLLSITLNIPLTVLIVLVSLPFVYMGNRAIGLSYAIRTMISICVLAASLLFRDFH
ncbi:MAG: hypothetical protein ACKO5I_08020 [Ignavibacteria bacterium]